MADTNFFDGGKLPAEFNHAAGGEDLISKEPNKPHLRYNPPQLVPGMSAPEITEVAQEELDGPTRDTISQAQDRMDIGENEMGDPILSPEFNRTGWTSQEISKSEQEDRERGLDLEPEWDNQAQHEYDRWALDTLQARHEDKWGERDAIEHYEEYRDNSFSPSPEPSHDIEHEQ